MSTLSSLLSIFAGIWMVVAWRDNTHCEIFTLFDDDDYYDNWYYNSNNYYYGYGKPDYCDEVSWGIVAFVQGVLWLLTSIFIWYVLCSGKFAKMERELGEDERESRRQEATVVEMGTVTPTPATNPASSNPGVAAAVMLPTEEANKYQEENNV